MELKDTVKMMCSDAYVERFIAEYNQTKLRYEKLKKFNDTIEAAERTRCYPNITPVAEPSHECPVELLRQQQHAMGEYLHVLELRAIIENIEL